MRIGVNTLFYIPGEVGGSETYLRQTLRAMVEARPDVEIVLFTNIENDETLRKDMAGQKQVSFAKMNLRAMNRYARIIREQVELPGMVRKAGVDVLWSPGYTACLTTNCPQVVTIHDMQFRNHAEDMNWKEWLATAFLVTASANSKDDQNRLKRYLKPYPIDPTKMTKLDCLEVCYPGGVAGFLKESLAKYQSGFNPDNESWMMDTKNE